MSTHNIGFYEDLTKIIFELSSNTHLISSAVEWESVYKVLLIINCGYSLEHLILGASNELPHLGVLLMSTQNLWF